MDLPEPFNRTFPNVTEALEEDLPLLCTILAGFEGLIFVTIATIHDNLSAAIFSPVLCLAPLGKIVIETKEFVLAISGISCGLLYFSTIASVYSRMSRYEHLLQPDKIRESIEIDGSVEKLILQEIRRLDLLRFKLANFAVASFNTAVALIFITGLVFAPVIVFSAGVYVIAIAWGLSMVAQCREWSKPFPTHQLVLASGVSAYAAELGARGINSPLRPGALAMGVGIRDELPGGGVRDGSRNMGEMGQGPPFRADHVGSLLRPAELLRARAQREAGRISAEELRRTEDDAIRDAARMQREVGLQGVTDGEFRRGSWHMDFLYQVGGVAKTDQRLRLQFRNEGGTVEAALGAFRIGGKLGLDKTIFGEDFAYLKSVAPAGSTPKLTIPSPSMLHYRGGRAAIDASVYPDMDAFWDDLARVYQKEIAGLAALGCTYLQLDDTSLAYLNDPAQRAYVTNIGGDGATQHLTNIKVINQALGGRPPGMTICTHMCRGNFRSSWMAEGGYDHVAEALFGELAVDGFFLEYDDRRSGGFEPLRFVPRGPKRVVLGLVTSKRAALESKDELKHRIDEAARYVPLEQLCLSPQCGFSSTVDGNALTIDEQFAKLHLVVETAREVWG